MYHFNENCHYDENSLVILMKITSTITLMKIQTTITLIETHNYHKQFIICAMEIKR